MHDVIMSACSSFFFVEEFQRLVGIMHRYHAWTSMLWMHLSIQVLSQPCRCYIIEPTSERKQECFMCLAYALNRHIALWPHVPAVVWLGPCTLRHLSSRSLLPCSNPAWLDRFEMLNQRVTLSNLCLALCACAHMMKRVSTPSL